MARKAIKAVKKPIKEIMQEKKPEEEISEIKAIENTKQLISSGKIPVEKLEETMEKILSISLEKEEKSKQKPMGEEISENRNDDES